jgi:uncharacterized membrane protein YgaE (UPF0421/DUF939 family)
VDLIPSPRGLSSRDLRLVAKIGLAAVLSWWVSTLLGANRPAFAAIVPLVALRADDPYGALGVSLFRIVGTVAGILLGVAALEVDPTAPLWLVAATIVLGLAIGVVARVPNEAINPITAVTALVVIFVGRGRLDTYAWDRTWETLVGAAVTMVVAVAVWPPDPIGGLRDLLGDLRRDVSEDLRDVALLPGRSLDQADHMLDERIRRSMDTGDVTRTLDRANSGLRWNPRQRGRRVELVALAVPIRQLMAMSRYSRSLLWSMVGDPDGDHIRRWPPEAEASLHDAMRYADDAAGEVATGGDPTTSIEAADGALARFASSIGGDSPLATDIHGGARAMLRVLSTTTSRRLGALIRERYLPGSRSP